MTKIPKIATEVALLDAAAAAAIGSMSTSWWHQQVADGTAPQPAFRRPRCTRWRLVDVVEFWRDFAELAGADEAAAARVTAQATKASEAAKRARAGGVRDA